MNIDYRAYKEHPRILELRFTLLFTMIEREYGVLQATKFYETIAENFHCDYSKLIALINKRFDIKRASKTEITRWRQEIIFMGRCLGVTSYKIANDYLDIKPSSLYNNPTLYNPEYFVTTEWLSRLNNEITLSGIKAYQTEIKRFLETMETLNNVLNRWVE